jgi:hypothetical protein
VAIIVAGEVRMKFGYRFSEKGSLRRNRDRRFEQPARYNKRANPSTLKLAANEFHVFVMV